jgi:hypothetical protein
MSLSSGLSINTSYRVYLEGEEENVSSHSKEGFEENLMKGIVDNYYVLVNFHKTRLRMPFDLS